MNEDGFKKKIRGIKLAFDLSGIIFAAGVLGFCVFCFLKMGKAAFLKLDDDWLLVPWVVAAIFWTIGWHFQSKAKTVRCPKCNDLFFAKGRGSGVVFADKCCVCGWDLNSVKED